MAARSKKRKSQERVEKREHEGHKETFSDGCVHYLDCHDGFIGMLKLIKVWER